MMKCSVKRKAIFLFSEISLFVTFLTMYSSVFSAFVWHSIHSSWISIHFSMNFHGNTEKHSCLIVISDSGLVKLEVLVRMYWEKMK